METVPENSSPPFDSTLSTSPISPISPISPTPDRLGMSFDKRMLLAGFSAMTCGFAFGSTHAGRLASLRYRAENAHRLPISTPGWYLYHKSKNYYKSRHAITEGVRKGVWLASWASIFFIIEESLDVFRGTWRAGRTLKEMEGIDELDLPTIDREVDRSRDCLSSALAGMVTGGIWSAWNRFPMTTAARTITMGVTVGLGYGVVQDGITYMKGRSVGYVDEAESWIYKNAKSLRNKMGEDEATAHEGVEQREQE